LQVKIYRTTEEAAVLVFRFIRRNNREKTRLYSADGEL